MKNGERSERGQLDWIWWRNGSGRAISEAPIRSTRLLLLRLKAEGKGLLALLGLNCLRSGQTMVLVDIKQIYLLSTACWQVAAEMTSSPEPLC